jgi:hypothetical protein
MKTPPGVAASVRRRLPPEQHTRLRDRDRAVGNVEGSAARFRFGLFSTLYLMVPDPLAAGIDDVDVNQLHSTRSTRNQAAP